MRTTMILAAVLTMALIGAAQAGVIHFQEGVAPTGAYTTGATYVYQGAGNTNANASGSFSLLVGYDTSYFGGNIRSLFEFDLSAIPGGATIQDVSLVLRSRNAAEDGYTGVGNSIHIELLSLAEDFDETTVTWNSLTPDGGSTSGTVLSSAWFDPTPAASEDITFATQLDGNFVSAATAALAAPDKTLRFIAVKGAGGDANAYGRFYYDEASAPAGDHPELIVTYGAEAGLVAEPAGLGLVGLALLGLKRKRS